MATEVQHPEIVKFIENISIAPHDLLEDNHSQEADELRGKWKENKRAGKLYALSACGDARVRFPKPEKYVTLKSIAAGGNVDSNIVTNAGVEFAVFAGHYDGEAFKPGEMPTGCGGLGAKYEALEHNKPVPVKGIGYYIARNIDHPDPLVNALLKANKIAKISNKPQLTIAQNHRIGEIFPFGVFMPGQSPRFAINILDLYEKYDPKEIYAKGIPELERRVIPEIFNEFLEACEAQVKESLLTYPNYKEMMRVQNPRMVVLSTEIMSAKIRYPKIASFPGILFKIHLPRIKNGSDVSIDPEKLQDVINQIEYPIPHAVENFGKPNESFSNTDRFLIETDDIDLSRKVALRLAEEEWMQKWMNLEGHQMLIVQTQEGISQLIEEFKQ